MSLHLLASALPGPRDLIALARRVERAGTSEHVRAYVALCDCYDLCGCTTWCRLYDRLAGALAGEGAVAS